MVQRARVHNGRKACHACRGRKLAVTCLWASRKQKEVGRLDALRATLSDKPLGARLHILKVPPNSDFTF